MILSSFGILAGASYSNELPADFDSQVESGVFSDDLKDARFFGLDLDFIYHSTADLLWATVPVDKYDVTMTKSNLNLYLLRVLKKVYADDKLYTAENASAVANFIGHLINEDHVDVAVRFGSATVAPEVFYRTIASVSGLGNVIQLNWCDRAMQVNFNPVLTALGVNLDKLLPSQVKSGQALAEVIIRTFFEKVFTDGPLSYAFNLLQTLSKHYSVLMLPALEALLAGKIARGVISKDELSTVKGLLNLIFNNNNPDDESSLQFVTVPVYRFGNSRDTTELFLYVMAYLNLIGRYKNNTNVVTSLLNDIQNSNTLEAIDKTRLNSIIEAAFFGDIDKITEIIDEISVETVQDGADRFVNSISTAITNFIKAITEFFDRIYRVLTGANR